MVINMELYEEIEITCKKCKESQTYHPRGNKIPKRPKTQCQKCGAWIYFNPSLLVKNDQKPNDQMTKTDQKRDQKKPSKPRIKAKSNVKTKNRFKNELTKSDDQRQKKIDQKLANFIRTISGQLVIAMNYAINSIKNKPEVVEKKQDATRYNYFKNWTQYRELFKKLEEAPKKEMNIIKKGE